MNVPSVSVEVAPTPGNAGSRPGASAAAGHAKALDHIPGFGQTLEELLTHAVGLAALAGTVPLTSPQQDAAPGALTAAPPAAPGPETPNTATPGATPGATPTVGEGVGATATAVAGSDAVAGEALSTTTPTAATATATTPALNLGDGAAITTPGDGPAAGLAPPVAVSEETADFMTGDEGQASTGDGEATGSGDQASRPQGPQPATAAFEHANSRAAFLRDQFPGRGAPVAPDGATPSTADPAPGASAGAATTPRPAPAQVAIDLAQGLDVPELRLDAPSGPAATPAASRPDAASSLVGIRNALLEAARTLQARSDGSVRLTVRLDPPELGHVRIELTSRGDQVHLAIRADSADGAEALQHQRGNIVRALQDQGLDLSGFDVNTRERGEGQNQQNPGQRQTFSLDPRDYDEAGQPDDQTLRL